MYEKRFMGLLGGELKIKIKRYIDDAWFIGKYKKGSRIEEKRLTKGILDYRAFCYHERMILESEGVEKRVKFLECEIERREGKWECEYRVKNEERKEAGQKRLKKFVEYGSYGDQRKIGIVMGAMSRVEQNCSEIGGVIVKSLEVAEELRRAGYLRRIIKGGMERMGRKVGGVWRRMVRIYKGGKKE